MKQVPSFFSVKPLEDELKFRPLSGRVKDPIVINRAEDVWGCFLFLHVPAWQAWHVFARQYVWSFKFQPTTNLFSVAGSTQICAQCEMADGLLSPFWPNQLGSETAKTYHAYPWPSNLEPFWNGNPNIDVGIVGRPSFEHERTMHLRSFEGSYPAMWQTTGQSGDACDPDCQKGMHATRWQRARTVDVQDCRQSCHCHGVSPFSMSGPVEYIRVPGPELMITAYFVSITPYTLLDQ